jgi:amino acid transporter
MSTPGVAAGTSANGPSPGRDERARLSPLLFLGFGIASIGGPIALVSFLPGAAGDALDSAGLVVVLALAVFAAPLGIWLAFSRRVVSPGGLSAFVGAAAGRRTAVAHGWIWSLAYFLYLPYTITFVVYDLLTPVFPGIEPYRSALELILPVAVVLFVFLPVAVVLAVLGVFAAAQIVAMVVLAIVMLGHTSPTFAASPGLDGTGRAAGATALLFICASLPLYLGAEVAGGSRTVRRGLFAATAVVGAALLLTAIPFSDVPDRLRDAPVPAAAVAQAYSGRELAVVIGLLTAVSTMALIVAEYLALGRLIHWLHGFPLRTVMAWIAVPFVLADIVSLIDPNRFYDDLLKPSLGALFVSQLVVFVVFPRFRRDPLALVATVVASGLAIWGLYTLIAGSAST